MKTTKEIKIEITGEEAESIVSDFVAEKMLNLGYRLADYTRGEDGPWPDTFWRGKEAKSVGED